MRFHGLIARSGVAAALLMVASPASPTGAAAAARPSAAVALPAAASTALQPAGVEDTWAWVTVRDGTVHGVQTPGPKNQGNERGGTNTVDYTGHGEYIVSFGEVGTSGGVANVTVLGTSARTCDVTQWGFLSGPAGESPPDETLSITCFNDSGIGASASFTAAFLDSSVPGGRLAYVWAGDWTKTNYTPDTEWNYNSTGTVNKIHREGVGEYRVTLPGLASARGDVQVGDYLPYDPTAGFSPSAARPFGVITETPTACNVASWGPHDADMRVYVRCRNLSGHLFDSQFQLTFTQSEGLKGQSGSDEAYLLANRAGSASYTPASAFRYSSPSGTPNVTRNSKGHYTVSLPNMPKGGAAIVTAYGSGKVRCNVASIETTGLLQEVGVRCRDFSGHQIDSKFTLSYLR